MVTNKIPQQIIIHSETSVMELIYENQISNKFPFEFLRVYSPSAEVTGHGQETIQVG